jgi:adenosylcobinamide-GDP ribazoletransferase
VLPVPGAGQAPDADALVALPIVGAVLGALAGCAGWAAAAVLPHAPAAAVALAALVGLSGALHLDGFLDGCDAFFAPVSSERRHAILKDPRCGSFALAGLLVAGCLLFATLGAIPANRYPAVLAFSGALARLAAVANAALLPAARPEGLAAPALARRTPAAPLVAEALVLALAAVWLAPFAWVLVPVAALLALGLGRWIARLLGGGLVGDAYGFIIIVVEIAVLAGVCGLLDGSVAGGSPGGG